MRRDDVLRILAEHREPLEALGATNVAIFGSVARDEARPDSDVDILIDLNRPMGLLALARIHNYFEDILGNPVDVVQRKNLKQRIRQRILDEAIVAA